MFLKWKLSYLYGRKHFLQVTADISTFLCTSFGVPRGFIPRLVLFKLCVADMFHVVSKCHYWQYAENTTIYTHCKIKNLRVTEQYLEADLNNLLMRSNEKNSFSIQRKKINGYCIQTNATCS